MKLVIEDEAGTRSIVPFAGEPIVVGRAPEGVTFRLTDRNVSRRHARFVLQNGSAFVEDLGSLVGTRVNGERITGKRRLRDGDLVQIGDYDLAVLPEATAIPGAGAPPPPLPSLARVGDPNAVTARLPITSELAAPPPPPARPPAPGRTARVAIAAGVVALALGIAAGLYVGAAFERAPPAPAVTPP
ncbi:MAG TPA: FHA domain-containing protein [Anaeromyxobacter sp.]|nr:FHA domain-containing protein [Anaeromyxobacter sp.]